MHVQQIVVHCTRRRRFPPGSWALNRTLLRPRVHPISGPDHVLGRCWRMEIPYTAVDTPEYWTRMPCLTLAYIVNIYVTSPWRKSCVPVSPDPCVMFVIYKYSRLAPGELSQRYAINRCGWTELYCMQFLIYNKCKLLHLIGLLATSRDKNNSGDTWVGCCFYLDAAIYGMMRLPVNQLQLSVVFQFNATLTPFSAARRYANACLCDSNVSIRPSVCHTPVLYQNEEN